MVKKIKKEQLLIGALIGILVLVIAIPVPKTEKNKQTEAVKEERIFSGSGIKRNLAENIRCWKSRGIYYL